MPKHKCYLGTLNKAKIQAVEDVLDNYDVIGLNVDSKVGAQPLSDTETIEGALNRALQLPKDGLRVGLEAGVQLHSERLFLVNWGVLIDEKDNVYYAGGTRIPLPDAIKTKLLYEKKELAEVMDEYTKIKDLRSTEGAISIFTSSLVQRKDIFIHIVKLLYGQYLRKEKK